MRFELNRVVVGGVSVISDAVVFSEDVFDGFSVHGGEACCSGDITFTEFEDALPVTSFELVDDELFSVFEGDLLIKEGFEVLFELIGGILSYGFSFLDHGSRVQEPGFDAVRA